MTLAILGLAAPSNGTAAALAFAFAYLSLALALAFAFAAAIGAAKPSALSIVSLRRLLAVWSGSAGIAAAAASARII